MSAHAALRKPKPDAAPDRAGARRGAEQKTREARPRWRVLVEPKAAAPKDHLPLERLREAGERPGLRRVELPRRAELRKLFGEEIPEAEVLTGPEVEAALDREGAEAAQADGLIFLRRAAPLPILAHEAAHVLQAARPRTASAAEPEAEALRVERRVEAGEPAPEIRGALAPGALVFRMRSAAPPPEAGAASGAPPAKREAAPPPAAPKAPAKAEAPAKPSAGAAPTPQIGPAPEPDIPQPEAAALEDAAQQTQADSKAVLTAFRAAPPSAKARQAAGLGERLSAAERQAEEDALPPTLSARLSGQAEPSGLAPPVVAAPQGAVKPLEAAPPPPPPKPELAPTPDPGPTKPAPDLGERLTKDHASGDQEAMERALREVQTRDETISASAGPRPDLALEGSADPERLAAQESAARGQAEALRSEAAQAVLEGPGPEQADLRQMAEDFTPEARAPPQIEAPLPVAGVEAFAQTPLDAESLALFDAHHAPAMSQSLAAAQEKFGQAVDERDAARATAAQTAEAEESRLNAEADAEQRAEVVARRGEIQTARRHALDQQADQVAELEGKAEGLREGARAQVETEAGKVETGVGAGFDSAEAEARREIDAGEAKAGEARDKALRESGEESWWDRALNWLKARVTQLTQSIGAIFERVRAKTREILEKAKSAAVGLIQEGAKRISGLIDACAGALQGLVSELLSAHFPAAAAMLTAAIGAAAAALKAAVDQTAALLVKGVSMAFAALAEALDAALASFQAAANAAMSLVSAALEGDWGALARLVLTPVLMAVGIPPDAFFQLFERAGQALDLILANPGGFLRNLLQILPGGLGFYIQNFGAHLRSGLLVWLAGDVGASLVMPQEFDLWGLLDILRQVAGLTLATLRQVATRVLGETAVEWIERIMTYVVALIRDGWRGLWDQLMTDLAGLRDMVFDQIRQLILTQVLEAGVVWLLSLFNPAGALAKLAKMIWDFIQFLNRNLARIFPVVQTVVNTLWQIATGVLEPPMRGVENALAKATPVLLDLLASLLGLSSIPKGVRKAIADIRETVEKAIEKAMRRFLEFLGIKTKDPDKEEAGGIMDPIRVQAGGESHTLLIKDEGETVRPIIRSDPTPLLQWLDGRLGEPFTAYAAEQSWDAATQTEKRAELQNLVAAAKAEEQALDAVAEQTEDALNAAQAAEAPASHKAEAEAAAQKTQAAGEETKSAVEKVLAFFGIEVVGLERKFAKELQALAASPSRAAAAENLRSQALRKLDAARYAPLDWAGFKSMLPTDGALTQPWREPASASGVARRFTAGTFDAAIREKAAKAAAEVPGRSSSEPLVLSDATLKAFYAGYLAERLNNAAARAQILSNLLESSGDPAEGLDAQIKEAVEAYLNQGLKPDQEIAQINRQNFETIFYEAATVQNKVYTYYEKQDENGAAAQGAQGTPHPLAWFLKPSGGSPRNGANRRSVSKAIRSVEAGDHEWIPTSMAYMVIEKAAQDFEASDASATSKASAVAKLIVFQNTVRTPKEHLIFNPQYTSPGFQRFLPYVSRAHYESGRPYAKLSKQEKDSFYPTELKFGEDSPVLQAHEWALWGRTFKDNERGRHGLWGAGSAWHGQLRAQISKEAAGGFTMRDLHEIKKNILSFFDQTIWSGTTDLGSLFDLYQHENQEKSYADMKAYATTQFKISRPALDKLMGDALKS